MKTSHFCTLALAGLLVLSALSAACTPAPAPPRTLKVLTHASFSVTKGLVAGFEQANNATVQFISGGDAGETLNKALLAKGNPLADVLYGVDNTFFGRAIAGDILEPYAAPGLADIPGDLKLDPQNRLLPVDFGYVDLNYDRKYFVEKSQAIPQTLEDLTKPAYKGLLVVENPAISSPGLAFLLATVGYFGESGVYTWQTFWQDLRKNDLLVVDDWNAAYYNEFSASGKGKRPLVVSYATSPALEVFFASDPKPAEPPTGNILPNKASFRQIEFVGVLKGSQVPDLARKFVDLMLSQAFQEDVPLQMGVYPANTKAALPDLFKRFAQVPAQPASVDAKSIDDNRDAWIQKWTQIVLK
jgi:thiamine transport system substrate-binding protein